MNTKHTPIAFAEKCLGHAPIGYGNSEAQAWANGYNTAIERSAAPELLAAGQAFERAYAACNTILAPMEREAFDQLVNAIAKATNSL